MKRLSLSVTIRYAGCYLNAEISYNIHFSALKHFVGCFKWLMIMKYYLRSELVHCSLEPLTVRVPILQGIALPSARESFFQTQVELTLSCLCHSHAVLVNCEMIKKI